jgi:hypothetical protein
MDWMPIQITEIALYFSKAHNWKSSGNNKKNYWLKYLIRKVSVNTTMNKQQLCLQFYSDMFRLTLVNFRLEIYYITKLLCSLWDLRRLHVFYIDVIYCIIIGGCSKRHCYSIITISLDVFSVRMDRGFGLVCYERRLDK